MVNGPFIGHEDGYHDISCIASLTSLPGQSSLFYYFTCSCKYHAGYMILLILTTALRIDSIPIFTDEEAKGKRSLERDRAGIVISILNFGFP